MCEDKYFCSGCGEFHSDWCSYDYYVEWVDANRLEYEVLKCEICGFEFDLHLNPYDNSEDDDYWEGIWE